MAVSRPRARRSINSVLNLVLLALLVVSFATGFIASLLGMTEFGVHKYSSIAVVIVASAHVGLHWRSFAAQIRRTASRNLR